MNHIEDTLNKWRVRIALANSLQKLPQYVKTIEVKPGNKEIPLVDRFVLFDKNGALAINKYQS